MDPGQAAEYWPGWLSGTLIAALVVAYFWVTGRFVSSSGRISALIDRLRYGSELSDEDAQASPEELAEALRVASVEAFGAAAVEAQLLVREPHAPVCAPSQVRPWVHVSWAGHLLFLLGLALGGRLARFEVTFAWTLGEGVWPWLPGGVLPYLLVVAGVLVGFGTRMAGGCPIGHGLCGMASGQRGSWAAGVAFFAGGVGLWFLLGAL